MKVKAFALLGCLLFCYVYLLLIKLLGRGRNDEFVFHWNTPFWMFVSCLIGVFVIWAVRRRFRLLNAETSSRWRDFLILVSLIPLNTILLCFFATAHKVFAYGKPHGWFELSLTYLVNLIPQTVVGFSCIAYFHFSALDALRERLALAQRARDDARLKLLQEQIDPHFLFNNLNVLSMLIERDPTEAGEFLERFADLYRYVLRAREVEFVPLAEELAFAKDYLFLISQRFGPAFDVAWEQGPDLPADCATVPAALQGLLENVVKHNEGSRANPLRVRIRVTQDALTVENERRPKRVAAVTDGTGLKNLRERYAPLTARPIEIEQDDQRFRVTLPLLRVAA
jgi:two-component system, LytTR family, sensor kinase